MQLLFSNIYLNLHLIWKWKVVGYIRSADGIGECGKIQTGFSFIHIAVLWALSASFQWNTAITQQHAAAIEIGSNKE